MESAPFHISSDYLKEGENASYNVVDWGDGFDILLYNYETENVAQISTVDMRYTVTAENATVSVNTQAGTPIEKNNNEYLFGKTNTQAYQILHVVPNSNVNVNDKVNVTVQSTSPFRKTLKAEFVIQNKYRPDYTITDQGNGTVLLAVKTNDYQGAMNVTWDPSKFSPDNTNSLMVSWQNSSPSESFSVNGNSTYELLFFKKTDAQYRDTNGTGTEITLN